MHAHIFTASRDCDGDYRSGHTIPLTLEEQAMEYPEYDFKQRVVASIISVYAENATLTVERERVLWHEQTDEGYRNTSVEWCDDNTCTIAEPWQRDLRAESMGY